MRRITKLFSFSNVIACIALFVALGGTVYAAGKISGVQIKPNSLPGNRVKAGTITGKQVKAGSLTAKQVVGSSLTGVRASSLATVQYATATIPLSEPSITGVASCPVGTKVIGGGATVSGSDAFLNDTGPTPDRNGWTANGRSFAEAPRVMTLTAICTPVVAPTG